MRRFRVWWIRLSGLFSRARRDQEFADELASHLQLHIEDNLRAGMSPEEARRIALLKLGGVEATKEAYRDRGTVPFMEHLAQDIRFGFRQLRANPGFTGTAVLVLTLGMCANLAIFAFVDAALIKPLPYPDSHRLVGVTESVAKIPRANLSYPDYLDWKQYNQVFSSLDIHTGTGFLLSTPTGAEPAPAARVSDGFFRTLGITPFLGRDFAPGEDLPGGPRNVIISYATWWKRFGGNQDIVGKQITLSGLGYTVIGVLPRTFHFAPRGRAEFWVTLQYASGCGVNRSCHSHKGIARLKEGVSIQAALDNMKSIAKQLEEQYPDSNRGQSASVVPLSEEIVGDIRPILLVLLGGAGLLLLIACLNVASLLLVRSESRRREFAVRRALGASSGRLVSQFVTEGSMLVAGACLLGVLSAGWVMQLLMKLIPTDMMAGLPFLQGLGLNARVLAYAGAVSLLVAVLFSVTPSLHLFFSEMREGLTEGSRGSAGKGWSRLGSRLVVVELTIAMVLLVSAGLLGKSLFRLLHVDLGFRPDHLATLSVAAPELRYAKDEERLVLERNILSRLSRVPGVQSVAITSLLPVSYNGNTDWIRLVGRPYSGEHIEVNEREVSAGYFETIGARIVRGRAFREDEDLSKPRVVVINQTLARQYFPGEDPIGKQMGNPALSPTSIKEIVGVVEDIKEGSLDSEIWPAVYYPSTQNPSTYFALVVRTSQAPQSILPSLSAAIHEIYPDAGTISEAAMEDRINDSQSAYLHRSTAWLVGGFAGTALLLGVVGLYGVIAYSVGQRTREIGVRMALGARKRSVYGLILKEAGWLTGLGIAFGLVCSIASGALIRNLLFGVSSWDLPTLAGVAVVLGVSALLASYVPARRATAVNPVEALRSE